MVEGIDCLKWVGVLRYKEIRWLENQNGQGQAVEHQADGYGWWRKRSSVLACVAWIGWKWLLVIKC
ncbi:hypothetical protein D3H65_03955 [Paraflavitalea soli]|uniref:Uncharacterized protein n=1 Tax=Paraflavitalea soli TaxID=2315862 RepID=A0A3B7MIX0_9BACT|nr:hypothetical protein D3H65_03955 [Paraflavitalea soli]